MEQPAATKRCTKCGVEKPSEAFSRDRTAKDGKTHRCKQCAIATSQIHRLKWHTKDPRHYERLELTRKFGLTLAEYDRMLEQQNGRCAICRTETPGRNRSRFLIDHDHATGRVRGLLCNACNMGIGQLGDDPQRIEAAAHYLRAFKGT
jgi:hypothetical protein